MYLYMNYNMKVAFIKNVRTYFKRYNMYLQSCNSRISFISFEKKRKAKIKIKGISSLWNIWHRLLNILSLKGPFSKSCVSHT